MEKEKRRRIIFVLNQITSYLLWLYLLRFRSFHFHPKGDQVSRYQKLCGEERNETCCRWPNSSRDIMTTIQWWWWWGWRRGGPVYLVHMKPIEASVHSFIYNIYLAIPAFCFGGMRGHLLVFTNSALCWLVLGLGMVAEAQQQDHVKLRKHCPPNPTTAALPLTHGRLH